jgi:hypothetical protein
VLQFFALRPHHQHYIILCHIPENSHTPFVVAHWYPEHGSTSWDHGTYHTDIIAAVADFADRMPIRAKA